MPRQHVKGWSVSHLRQPQSPQVASSLPSIFLHAILLYLVSFWCVLGGRNVQVLNEEYFSTSVRWEWSSFLHASRLLSAVQMQAEALSRHHKWTEMINFCMQDTWWRNDNRGTSFLHRIMKYPGIIVYMRDRWEANERYQPALGYGAEGRPLSV